MEDEETRPLNVTREEAMAARAKMLESLRRRGVSADLIEKIRHCYDYLAGGGMGKTTMVANHLIYYMQRAEKEASVVAALGCLVEEEPPCSTS